MQDHHISPAYLPSRYSPTKCINRGGGERKITNKVKFANFGWYRSNSQQMHLIKYERAIPCHVNYISEIFSTLLSYCVYARYRSITIWSFLLTWIIFQLIHTESYYLWWIGFKILGGYKLSRKLRREIDLYFLFL